MKSSSTSASSASSRRSHTVADRSGKEGRHCRKAWRAGALVLALGLAACQTTPPKPPPTPPPPQIKTITIARYELVAFERLPALQEPDLSTAWSAWLTSCKVLQRREVWRALCADSAALDARDAVALLGFLATRFDAWRLLAETREDSGTNGGEPRILGVTDAGRITGYYEPLLLGSRVRDARFAVPLYRTPEDLLVVDLASLYPELAGKRVRGRLVETPNGKRVVPYYPRAELSGDQLAGRELVWVDDAIEAFFLQIQGSGRVQFADGSQIRLGYADTNGHPYRSIGRVLIDRGELTFEQASMQGIQAWARANPARVTELLNQNPSVVFFRELPVGDPAAGPVGAMGVALTPGYSIAADPQFIPLGAPVLIATQHPSTAEALTRLVLAQDTGGAIRGPIRFDFFWGFGKAAAEHAGRQRHDVQAWLLLPKGVRPETLLANKQ